MANQMRLGENLRNEGLRRIEANASDWLVWIRREAIKHSAKHGSVSSGDLRQIADEADNQPHHPNAWGAIFRQDCWDHVGYVKNRRPSAHYRDVKVWQYVGSAAP